MKKLLTILLLLSIVLTGCTVDNPGYSNTQLIDDDGEAYGIPQIDGKPRISSMPYTYDIAEGNISGHTPWTKTGYNPNVGTTQETVWSYSTEYVFPAAAMQMEVVSSDNTQDKPGGTGALSVYMVYLDGNYIEHTETLTLNGTTAVPTVATDIYRVNNVRCASVGTGGKPVGNITLRGVGGGSTYSYMLAGYTRARNSVYTVPAGKTLFINSIMFSCADATKGVRFINQATYDNLADTMLTPGIFFMPYTEATLYNNVMVKVLEVPTKLPEKTDIRVSVISGQAGALADVQLKGWLEDN